jgi:hypothetical protein
MEALEVYRIRGEKQVRGLRKVEYLTRTGHQGMVALAFRI